MRIIALFFIFLIVGALLIVSNNDLHLINSRERAEFFGLYSSWIGNLFDNFNSISGFIVKSEWLPFSLQNKTSP